VAKSCCDAFVASGVVDPGTLLTALNRALYRPTRPIHMTGVAAMFDPGRGQVIWANAGHQMPYFIAARDERLGVLTGAGPMLGYELDASFASSTRGLARGDAVLLYTDGLVDAMNGQRAPFGERRLQKALIAAKTAAPPRVRDALVKAVDDFKAGAPSEDDELLVYVRAT
jgi:sigma-B regulation protein RsbU (phosphoserine phosphatase)